MKAPGEKGIALLTALLAVSLLSVIVLEFAQSTQVDQHLVHNTLAAAQARYLARSGVNAAEALLLDDDDRQHDDLLEDWAQDFPPLPAGEGRVEVTITDEARKVNLNAMVHGKPNQRRIWEAVTRRLFENLGLDPDLVDALIDWIDRDDDPLSRDGAERDYYLGLVPPRLPANGPLVTVSELAAIRGFDPATVNKLRPYVTVASEGRINLNTAPKPVLAALSQLLQSNRELLEDIAYRQLNDPFSSPGQIGKVKPILSTDPDIRALRSVRSGHFRVVATAVVRDVPWRISAILKRNQKTIERVSWEVTRPLTSPEPSDVLSEESPS